MKKVILTGVTLLSFVAASYAQNTATLNQNGSLQTAVQQQTGALQNSTINQNQGALVEDCYRLAPQGKPGRSAAATPEP